jgi:hypothetical protein
MTVCTPASLKIATRAECIIINDHSDQELCLCVQPNSKLFAAAVYLLNEVFDLALRAKPRARGAKRVERRKAFIVAAD